MNKFDIITLILGPLICLLYVGFEKSRKRKLKRFNELLTEHFTYLEACQEQTYQALIKGDSKAFEDWEREHARAIEEFEAKHL